MLRLLARRDFEVFVWEVHQPFGPDHVEVVERRERWAQTGLYPLSTEDETLYEAALRLNRQGRLWPTCSPRGVLYQV